MYQHVLAAIDLLDTDVAVLRKAKDITDSFGAELSVLHVCEPHVTGYGETTARNHIANDIQIKQSCFPQLKNMLDKVDASNHSAHLLFGRAVDVIHQYANDHGCDLIVVGSHGYEGVKAMLGSTAHKVLHGAKCDVHTVRINKT